MADKTIYFETRELIKQKDVRFKSRASASEYLGIGEDRLGDIETGATMPKPDEIVALVKAYNAPELYNYYCNHVCEIGKEYLPQVDTNHLDLFRVTMQLHNAVHEMEDLEGQLMKIADDGIVTDDEAEAFEEVLESVDSLAARTTALKLWAHKHFKS